MKTVALREKDLAELHRVFEKFSCVREVRVFGSRATDNAKRASDLDLAIFAPAASAGDWARIIEAVETTPIIYEFDIVRTGSAGNSRLLEKIAGEGVTIYRSAA